MTFDPFGQPIDPNPAYVEPPQYWPQPPTWTGAPPAQWAPQWVPPSPPRASSERPAGVVTSAVLGYVAAGMLIIAGFVIFASTSDVNELNTDFGSPGAAAGPLTALALADLLSAGLLIGGAAMIVSRRKPGRTLLLAGGGICAILATVWLAISGTAAVFWALLFCALVILAAIFATGPRVTAWLNGT